MTSEGSTMTAESRRSGETALLSPDGRFLAAPGKPHGARAQCRDEQTLGDLLWPPGRHLPVLIRDHQSPGLAARWQPHRFGQRRRVDPPLARAKRDPRAHARPAAGGLRGAGAEPVGRWVPYGGTRKGYPDMATQQTTQTSGCNLISLAW